MDITVLKTFVELAKVKHFGKAANNLCVTQSTVSFRIRLLEESFGYKMFTRDRNNIQLTAKGEIFYKHAESMVRNWVIARQEMLLEKGFDSSFKLGFNIDLWSIFVSDLAHGFLSDYSAHQFNLELCDLEDIGKRILAEELDAGFVFDFHKMSGIKSTKIRTIELKMVSTFKDISLKDALKKSYILVDWGIGFINRHQKLFGESGLSALSVSHGIMAKDILLSSGGSTFLPEKIWHQDPKAKKLNIVKDAPIIERDIYLIAIKNPKPFALEILANIKKKL